MVRKLLIAKLAVQDNITPTHTIAVYVSQRDSHNRRINRIEIYSWAIPQTIRGQKANIGTASHVSIRFRHRYISTVCASVFENSALRLPTAPGTLAH